MFIMRHFLIKTCYRDPLISHVSHSMVPKCFLMQCAAHLHKALSWRRSPQLSPRPTEHPSLMHLHQTNGNSNKTPSENARLLSSKEQL